MKRIKYLLALTSIAFSVNIFAEKAAIIEHDSNQSLLQRVMKNQMNSATVKKHNNNNRAVDDALQRAIERAKAPSKSDESTISNNSNKDKRAEDKTITLLVTADGSTKEEAVKNALWLAIEQAYGIFVSADPTPLNNSFVKDEVTANTNGAIKEYKEIVDTQPSDSHHRTTVKATVSLSNLIHYAKNHGSDCELAGSLIDNSKDDGSTCVFSGKAFATELKLFELEKENELKALYNLIPEAIEICKNTMHWELEISEPYIPQISKRTNDESECFTFHKLIHYGIGERLYTSTEDFNLTRDKQYGEQLLDKEFHSQIFEFFNNVNENPSDYCGININIWWLPKGKKIEFAEILKDHLREMCMDYDTYQAYEKKGYALSHLMDRDCNFEETSIYKPYIYHSRLKQEYLEEWYQILMKKILNLKYNFIITDAKGYVSDFHHSELSKIKDNEVIDYASYHIWQCEEPNNTFVVFGGTGLFNPLALITTNNDGRNPPGYNPFTEFVDVEGNNEGDEIYWDRSYRRPRHLERGKPGWEMSVIVPMKDAAEFTSFKIKAK